jgi:GT2 family glycosyltransferase
MAATLLSIVTWNSAATIEACLRSALAQTHPDFDLWVIDNASADNTCALVEAIAATDARLQLHRLPQNTGFCGGHNYALDRTDHAQVLLVNPDVEMQPDYLEKALEALAIDARIGTVCGVLLQSEGPDPAIDSAGLLALPDGRFRLRYHGLKLSEANFSATIEDVPGADGALPLYRREFIDDLRLEGRFFDERFFAHKEDWDISWRGQLYGWRTVLATQCRALHPRAFRPANVRLRLRLSGSIKTDAVKNQLLLLIKNPTPAQLPWLWLRALPRQLAIFLFMVVLERQSLRAYSYAWRHRQALWASRQVVQARAALGWQPTKPAPEEAALPLLSICVPCYHRPDMLERALRSLGHLPAEVELIISDNSTQNDLCEQVTRRVLANEPSTRWTYYHNLPGGCGGTNWVACVERARGHYILMLHDDDYLLPGSVDTMLRVLRQVKGTYHSVLFGVNVVDIQRRVLQRQTPARTEYLPPAAAVEELLTNSSLIRVPAMVVSREVYRSTGGPDPSQNSTDDTDLWLRVFAEAGVYKVPVTTCAYTIHDGAMTTGVFNQDTIQLLLNIFSKARNRHLLSEDRLNRAEAHFFHQFVLAGAYRSLCHRDTLTAREVLHLLKQPDLQRLPTPARWLPARLGLELCTRLNFVPPLVPNLSQSVSAVS